MRLLLLGCLVLGATPLWAGDVYRSIDENGNVRYSDRPEGAHPERIHIAVPEPAAQPPAPAASAAKPPAASQQAGGDQPAADAPAKPAPTPAEQAAERAHNCSIATDRLQRYQQSHRLYRQLPNGEREYLSDAEIDEARSRAADEVKKWCN